MKPVLIQLGERLAFPKRNRTAVTPTCIFLTATISPPSDAVTRNDPSIRLRDYLDSLEFYLSLPTAVVNRVLFVDNSGSDITPIEEFVRSRIGDKAVELMSFEGNDHPITFGKAYGEFKLLDFGIERTALLDDDDYFWKVTGRLRVLNLAQMIAAIDTQYNILCDLHNFPFIGTGKAFGNHWMELRLFSCTRRAYRELFAGKYEQFGPRMNQDVLYDVIMAARGQWEIIPRFHQQPIIVGVSGRHGREYHSGLQNMKTVVRGTARKLLPFMWI